MLEVIKAPRQLSLLLPRGARYPQVLNRFMALKVSDDDKVKLLLRKNERGENSLFWLCTLDDKKTWQSLESLLKKKSILNALSHANQQGETPVHWMYGFAGESKVNECAVNFFSSQLPSEQWSALLSSKNKRGGSRPIDYKMTASSGRVAQPLSLRRRNSRRRSSGIFSPELGKDAGVSSALMGGRKSGSILSRFLRKGGS